MKNPGDADKLIDELIEKKYSEDKFSLNDLMKLVEGQLDELYKIGSEEPYSGKYQKGPPDFEENVEQGKQIAYAAGFGGTDPRNPRNDSDEFNPSAGSGLAGQAATTGRISMIPEGPVISGASAPDGKSKASGEKVEMIIPDLLSMLISQHGQAPEGNSNERELLQQIINRVAGSKDASPLDVIRALNSEIKNSGTTNEIDFSSSVSKLMLLSLFQKITHDVSNLSRGGLFEYLMAVIFGKNYNIIPISKNDIADISDGAGGKASLKILDAEKAVIKGSIKALEQYRSEGLEYLICLRQPSGQKSSQLSFYEITFAVADNETIQKLISSNKPVLAEPFGVGIQRKPKAYAFFESGKIKVYLHREVFGKNTQFNVGILGFLKSIGAEKNLATVLLLDDNSDTLKSVALRLNQNIRTIFENLKYLNMNLASYFSTEKSARKDVGSAAVQNAKNIQASVSKQLKS